MESGKTLKDALAQLIPSLDVGTGGRTNYGQNMRGRKMMVMINGVSVNSSRRISRHLDAIDAFNIDHIEVVSRATAIYVGNAVGGVINIITKRPTKEFAAEAQIGIKPGFSGKDDYDENLAASVSGDNDRVAGNLSVALIKSRATLWW